MIGTSLSHYRIVEKLGAGGMGEVYLAEDSSLQRKVALKFLPAEMQQDTTARKRLLREARSAAALDHPYICHINEVGETEGQDYIAMEYVEGQSLKDRLATGPMPLKEALQAALEVTEALEAAHGKGIIHRDIKPGNIMLTAAGHAKVMDFGLAKQTLTTGTVDTEKETVTALTQSGAAIGTLAYMSPEQLRGQPADGRSDLWALGVTLYEMVAGVRPFQGQSGFELTASILNQQPPPLPSELPGELGAVIGRCLEKDPRKRCQTSAELREALSAVQAGTVSPWVGWRYRIAHSRWPVIATALLALVILAGILVGLDVGGLRSRLVGTPVHAVKLAVLPFVNLTGDPEQEYLSDGMTEEMIAQLGRLHPQSLSVIARTSVMRYKKTEKPIDQIGKELGVGYILEGGARREGGRIRITTELIKVANQTQLWAETYEREMAGILALQAEVARKVVGSLALKLLPAEQANLTNVRTVNPDAYDACLKGFHHLLKLTRADLETAERYFNLALQRDANYAAAWAGIARVWNQRGQGATTRLDEASAKAKAAALKALELDDTSWEAHRALAGILTFTEWDWPAAAREWNRTIELNPGDADTLAGYSHFLMRMGRQDEAMAQIERALELDPFNVKVQIFYAQVLLDARRWDDAIAAARKARSMEPNARAVAPALIAALFEKGMYDEALAVEREGCALDRELTEALEKGYAEGSHAGANKRLADTLAARFGKPSGAQTIRIAALYYRAGDRDRALEWLERAYAERNHNLPAIAHFDSLRSDPRFQALLRKMNLPQ